MKNHWNFGYLGLVEGHFLVDHPQFIKILPLRKISCCVCAAWVATGSTMPS